VSALTGTGASNVQERRGGQSRGTDRVRRGVAAREVGVVLQRRVEGVALVDDERPSVDSPPEAIVMRGRRGRHDGATATADKM